MQLFIYIRKEVRYFETYSCKSVQQLVRPTAARPTHNHLFALSSYTTILKNFDCSRMFHIPHGLRCMGAVLQPWHHLIVFTAAAAVQTHLNLKEPSLALKHPVNKYAQELDSPSIQLYFHTAAVRTSTGAKLENARKYCAGKQCTVNCTGTLCTAATGRAHGLSHGLAVL